MSSFSIMCVPPFRSLILSFTDCIMWVWRVDQHIHVHPPFMCIYALVLMCMCVARRVVGHETTAGTLNFTLGLT